MPALSPLYMHFLGRRLVAACLIKALYADVRVDRQGRGLKGPGIICENAPSVTSTFAQRPTEYMERLSTASPLWVYQVTFEKHAVAHTHTLLYGVRTMIDGSSYRLCSVLRGRGLHHKLCIDERHQDRNTCLSTALFSPSHERIRVWCE